RKQSFRSTPFPKTRKGQFGVYLKPIIVIIFGLLLIFALRTALQTETQLEKSKAAVQLQEAARQDFQQLSECLSVSNKVSGSRYLINISRLKKYSEKFQRREPPCAEDFKYGYTAVVRQKCLRNISIDVGEQQCETTEFSFGETEGSTPKSLRQDSVLVFPVTLRHTKYTKVPATMSIQIRDGDLERLAGEINQVIKTGKERVGVTEATARYVNEQTVCAGTECEAIKPNRQDSVCLDIAGDPRCVVTRSNVQPFKLGPGSHLIKIEYRPETEEVALVE
ncbi:MAG: hypothetical protein SVV03_04460, partial [Candidatus Nanohaloarchaea archaeon]|nr:hypothetical protein [Candidatus Nanohaloarchaea archaeon]